VLSARRAWVMVLSVAVSVCALGWACSSAFASYAREGVGSFGATHPTGVAVDQETGNVFVAEGTLGEVAVFGSEGSTPIGAPSKISALAPTGEPIGVAVDNACWYHQPRLTGAACETFDPSNGDLYVANPGGNAIEKLALNKLTEEYAVVGSFSFKEPNGVAVDHDGNVYVADYYDPYIAVFNPAGVEVGRVETNATAKPVVTNPAFVGVGAPGVVYASDYKGGTAKYGVDSAFETESEADLSSTGRGIDVDASGIALVDNGSSVSEFSPSGQPVGTFGSELAGSYGVATNETSGIAYASAAGGGLVNMYSPRFALPEVQAPTGLGMAEATLNGVVDPEGQPVTSCVFEYGTSMSYGETASCAPSPGSGLAPVAVSAEVAGLLRNTRYHYRLVVVGGHGTLSSDDAQFTTPGPVVDAESASSVSSTSATLEASIYPQNAPTTYYFQYGTSKAYGVDVPEAPGESLGSGEGGIEVSRHVQGLTAGTTYHYRLVANRELKPGETQEFDGPDHTFITQPAIAAAGPDGRSWEMVSPPNKQGALLTPIGQYASVQAASTGGAITYVANNPTELEPSGNRAPENIQVFSQRTSQGWSTKVIATQHDTTHESLGVGSDSEYRMFSPDLSLSLLQPSGATPLSGETTEKTPYLRHDLECETNPAHCYQPLVTAENVPQGTKFGGPGVESREVTIAGASPDFGHVMLQSKVSLTSGGTPGLYEWYGGRLTFIGAMQLGYEGRDVRHAVSEDGSRVIGTGASGGLEGFLMWDGVTETTIKLDNAEPGAAGGVSKPFFQDASSDGSKVFFTDSAMLTVNSTATDGQPDLYEFNVNTDKLTDLSVDPHAGEHANVMAVLGVSEDGSYVYFAAAGALAEGSGPSTCTPEEVDATCNLYVWHDGTTRLVAVLSAEDANWPALQESDELTAMGTRVSPTGNWFSFMSNRSLTGYDNRDVQTGKPDEEIYLYDAGTNNVVCASCVPTGARPVGEILSNKLVEGKKRKAVNASELWEGVDVAATVPGWTNISLETAYNQSRYLSDSGRLFFNSDSALVPQDTDGTWDVYEYEPPGVGGCQAGGSGFVAVSGGCVGLISSGGASEESVFMEASENGDDVFFLTNAGLAPQDYDGVGDLYDAHVCSSGAPCFPAPVVAPPPCSTGDSCKAAPTPQPQVFGEPSSQTFSGAGDITTVVGGAKVRSEPLTRAQKLAGALKTCHKVRAKGKRHKCERGARKRYAANVSAKRVAGKSRRDRTVHGQGGIK
jgi:hypothetical protein